MNIRPENVKLLEENIGDKFLDFGLGNDFLELTPKAKAAKAKILNGTKSNGTRKLLHRKGNH